MAGKPASPKLALVGGDRLETGELDLLAQVRRGGERGPAAGGKLDIDRAPEDGALPTGAD